MNITGLADEWAYWDESKPAVLADRLDDFIGRELHVKTSDERWNHLSGRTMKWAFRGKCVERNGWVRCS